MRKQEFYRGESRRHLIEIQLRQLADDQLPAEERKEAVRHLLARCRPCLDLAREILFPEIGSEPDYSGVLRRLDLALVLARNDVEVERGVARLSSGGSFNTRLSASWQ